MLDSGTGFAATSKNIIKTTDRGDSWKIFLPGYYRDFSFADLLHEWVETEEILPTTSQY
jgi:hypothetical protein